MNPQLLLEAAQASIQGKVEQGSAFFSELELTVESATALLSALAEADNQAWKLEKQQLAIQLKNKTKEAAKACWAISRSTSPQTKAIDTQVWHLLRQRAVPIMIQLASEEMKEVALQLIEVVKQVVALPNSDHGAWPFDELAASIDGASLSVYFTAFKCAKKVVKAKAVTAPALFSHLPLHTSLEQAMGTIKSGGLAQDRNMGALILTTVSSILSIYQHSWMAATAKSRRGGLIPATQEQLLVQLREQVQSIVSATETILRLQFCSEESLKLPLQKCQTKSLRLLTVLLKKGQVSCEDAYASVMALLEGGTFQQGCQPELVNQVYLFFESLSPQGDLEQDVTSKLFNLLLLPQLNLSFEKDLEAIDGDAEQFATNEIEQAEHGSSRFFCNKLVRYLISRDKESTLGILKGLVNEHLSEASLRKCSRGGVILIKLLAAALQQSFSIRTGVLDLTTDVSIIEEYLGLASNLLKKFISSPDQVLVAALLKFGFTFRQYLSPELKPYYLEASTNLLQSSNLELVPVYAASFIDKLLIYPDLAVAENAEIMSCVLTSVTNYLLKQRSQQAASAMFKAVKLIGKEKILMFAEPLLGVLQAYLEQLSSKPAGPAYLYLLFEIVTKAINLIVEADSTQIVKVEQSLVPALCKLIDTNSTNCQSYVFQTLALLVRLEKEPLLQQKEVYMNLLQALLSTENDNWVEANRHLIPSLQQFVTAMFNSSTQDCSDQINRLAMLVQHLLSPNMRLEGEAFALCKALMQQTVQHGGNPAAFKSITNQWFPLLKFYREHSKKKEVPISSLKTFFSFMGEFAKAFRASKLGQGFDLESVGQLIAEEANRLRSALPKKNYYWLLQIFTFLLETFERQFTTEDRHKIVEAMLDLAAGLASSATNVFIASSSQSVTVEHFLEDGVIDQTISFQRVSHVQLLSAQAVEEAIDVPGAEKQAAIQSFLRQASMQVAAEASALSQQQVKKLERVKAFSTRDLSIIP